MRAPAAPHPSNCHLHLSECLFLSLCVERREPHKLTREGGGAQVLQREDGYFECMAWEDDKADPVEPNPFADLPFLIDGETVIAMAPASSDYLAHKLAGGDEVARSRNQQALAVSYELLSDALRVLYAPTDVYEMGHRGHLERTVRMHYAKLDQWLKMHGTAYLSADAPASADFELWEMLDMHELWANDVGCTRPLTYFQHLTKLYESMRLLPELQSYFRGPAFDLPFNNKMARFRQTNSSKHDALSAPGTHVQQERAFLGTLIALTYICTYPHTAWLGTPSLRDDRHDAPLPPPSTSAALSAHAPRTTRPDAQEDTICSTHCI